MLQAMEKAGAIERRSDQHDQRLTRVHLTAAGRELETGLRAVSAATINETIGALSAADRSELERLLNTFAASISAALDARRGEHAARAAHEDEAAHEGEAARDGAPAQAVAGDAPAAPERGRREVRP
jgi:DNA-binding PadR family transcriptional regulator